MVITEFDAGVNSETAPVLGAVFCVNSFSLYDRSVMRITEGAANLPYRVP